MKYLLIITIFFITLAGIQSAQESNLPIDIQIVMMPKVLMLEKNLYPTDKIVVGVLYDSLSTESVSLMKKISKLVRNEKYEKENVKFVFQFYDISKIEEWNDFLLDGIQAAYITSIQPNKILSIIPALKEKRIISFTGDKILFRNGLSVLLGREKNKPKIIINLDNARKEGANFSSHLLRMATVIEK